MKILIKYSFIVVFVGISNFSQAQELQSLIDDAFANNPEIQKFELQYKIASEKVNEVNVIPNTEFGVGYFISEPETRTVHSVLRYPLNKCCRGLVQLLQEKIM